MTDKEIIEKMTEALMWYARYSRNRLVARLVLEECLDGKFITQKNKQRDRRVDSNPVAKDDLPREEL